MFKCINGFTKTKMIEMIILGNNGTQSMGNGTTNCAYRGRNGNKCPVGCFIPDELYHTALEGRDIGSIYSDYPEIQACMPLNQHGMFSLQSIHDRYGRTYDIDGENLEYGGLTVREAVVNWIKKNVED